MRGNAHLAKLSRPSAAGMVRRDRLFALLDGLRPGRCIWVRAPAGAGKTSLVTSWVAALNVACSWYAIDAGDADPASFFHYLGLLAKSWETPGKKGSVLPHLTPDRMPALDVFVRRFFEAFFLRSGTPFVLVLDNVQDAAREGPFHAILAGLLDAMPQGALLVCLSREEPAPALARWVAHPGFRILEGEELRLDDGEARELARLAGADDRVDVAALNERVRGWAAGLALMVRARVARIDVAPTNADVPQLLFDYIATEVFDRTPAPMRDFLLRTSMLPHVIPDMARELTGRAEAHDWLAWLYRRRLFTSLRRDRADASYEYHPLFRAYLRDRALREIASGDLLQLRGRCARLLEGIGELDAAATLWAEAGEWAQVERLVRTYGSQLLVEGRIAIIEAWIHSVPEQHRSQSPWLTYWLGTCRASRDPASGRKSLEAAYGLFRARGNATGAFLALAGIFFGFYYQWADVNPLDSWIAQFDALLAENDGVIPPAAEIPVLSSCVAVLSRQPGHPRLPRLMERAVELMSTLEDAQARVLLAGFVICAMTWSGHYARARPLCDLLWRSSRQSTAVWPRIYCGALAGCVMWQQAEHETARAVLDEALRLAVEAGIPMLEPIIQLQRAYTALSAGDPDAAERALDAGSAALFPGREVEAVHYDFMRAGVLLSRGELQRALALATGSLQRGLDVSPPFGQATFRIQVGQMLMLSARHPEAREHLGLAIEYAERMRSDIILFQARMALAWSLLQTREHEAATRLLAAALATGRSQDYMNCHPWWIPEVMSQLCAHALEANIEVEYVRRLILKRGLVPPGGQAEQDAWPYRLRIYTLGRFSVVIDGEALRFTAKAQKKPLELLKAVIALGGRGVAIGTLVQELWPDLEGDAAHNALHVALHRLRRLLGDEDMVSVQESSLFVSPRLGWVDAWAFERVAGLTAELPADGDAGRVRCLAARVQQLYSGHFLADESMPCAVLRRERLRSKFVRASSRLGSLLEARNDFADARDIYQRALEMDPLAEEFHRGVMRCLKAQGRVPEALEAYRRCRQLLSVALGVQPSAETQALYRVLAG